MSEQRELFRGEQPDGRNAAGEGARQGSKDIPANRPLGFTAAYPARRLQLGIRLTF